MNNHYFIDLFEKRLCEYTGAKYAVLTDSCTNALFLSLYYLKNFTQTLDTKKSLVIPQNNYVSVPMQIHHLGLKFKFENIKWSGIYQLGNSPVYDAAQRFTSNMYIKDTFMCLSFQQKKILKIGKGGAILLDDLKAYKTLKRLSWDGRDSSRPVSKDSDIILGFHMNMTPEMASKGILELNQLAQTNEDNGGHDNYPNLSEYSVFSRFL